MMAGCVPEWLSLPKLFGVIAAVIRRSAHMPQEKPLMCSCLRAYFRLRWSLSSAGAVRRSLEQCHAAGTEVDAPRPHGHRQRAGARHAGCGIHFEEMHTACAVHNQVGAGDVTQSEGSMGGDSHPGRLLDDGGREP